MEYYVYIYLRKDGSPYYVGKGKNTRWCCKNRIVEVPPNDRVIFPITNTSEEWAHFMEMEFIDLYGKLNDGTGILENCTDGGEGFTKRHTEETKKKMSASRMGHPGYACGESNYWHGTSGPMGGKTHTEETKEKMRGKRKPMPPRTKEHCEKLKKCGLGKEPGNKGTHWWTNGSLNKMSKDCPSDGWYRGITAEGTKGRTLSAEHTRKISEAGKGRKHTEESKRKMSEAMKGNTNGKKSFLTDYDY